MDNPTVEEHTHRNYFFDMFYCFKFLLHDHSDSNHSKLHFSRARPTLKPAAGFVSKAQEFIDIYRFPPTRPDSLYPQPTPDKTAAKCRKDVCLLPDCFCGGKDVPGIFSFIFTSYLIELHSQKLFDVVRQTFLANFS